MSSVQALCGVGYAAVAARLVATLYSTFTYAITHHSTVSSQMRWYRTPSHDTAFDHHAMYIHLREYYTTISNDHSQLHLSSHVALMPSSSRFHINGDRADESRTSFCPQEVTNKTAARVLHIHSSRTHHRCSSPALTLPHLFLLLTYSIGVAPINAVPLLLLTLLGSMFFFGPTGFPLFVIRIGSGLSLRSPGA